MIVGMYRIKYYIYKFITTWYQFCDIARFNPLRERASRALNNTVDYIEEHLPNAMGFYAQRDLLDFTLDQIKLDGHYLEFGVYMGGSIRYMAKRKPHIKFHGFDSFEGLPEKWTGFNVPASGLTVNGKLPKVPSNVSLYKGWFNETLPIWCTEHPGPIAFINIDCDIYSSTVDILTHLESQLTVGTIILFDEYFNYPGWEQHEFKAWKEFVERTGIQYEYIGYARLQVAVRIKALGSEAGA